MMQEELNAAITADGEESLQHYGMPRRSGRYPWGSGDNPFQHEKFYQSVQMLKSQGLTDKEIMAEFNMNSTEYRAEKTVATAEHKKAEAIRAKELASMTDEEGNRLYSNVEIGRMLGRPEGTIRNYLKSDYVGNSTKIVETMEQLKAQCTDKNYIDVGPGSEFALGCSAQRLSHAVKILKESEGYTVEPIYVKQLGTGLTTTVKTLAPPGTTKEEIYDNKDYIKPPSGGVEAYPIDANGGKLNAYAYKPPVSIDKSRVAIRYAEDGGLEKDGVIEIRRGVTDLSLGNANYAQVRIMVNNSHYLKGMAVYSDNLPEGKDIIFNTNKKKDVPMLGKKDNSVLKPLKDDPDNPFGATIDKQLEYTDKDGKTKLSPINIVNEEGSWGGEAGWSKSIASQMLSKQNLPLIKRQLKLSYSDKVSDYDDIMSVTNPVVRKKLLDAFAESCDTAAVHLKASPFPHQTWNVILPVESLSPNEIYARNYKDGETVVLIRYPHGGTFEIPQLVVNNKNPEALRTLGQAVDAVGINAKVAERLSGADFDGDTVLVIPANSSQSHVKINTQPPLAGLDGFDPKTEYAYREGMKVMGKEQTQIEMGIISNLITDMTLKGAPVDELAAAVRHSMVVIDAHKHKLDYKRSYEENHIEELKEKWQKRPDGGYGGASTLLSKAKSVAYVDERKDGVYITDPVTGNKKKQYIDPETGEKLYSYTGRTKRELIVDKTKPLVDEDGNYVLDKKGKKQYEPILDPETGRKMYRDTGEKVKQTSTQMYETKDAHTLSSGLAVEEAYADYANKLKGLANEARKAYLATPSIKYNPEAKIKYAEEVESLTAKLAIAKKNAPRERQAQILANLVFEEKKAASPTPLSDEEETKLKNQALAGARATTGAKKSQFNGNPDKGLVITPKEWEAIQSGAISNNFLTDIVKNSDIDYLKKLSMPKATTSLSSAKISQIKNMTNSGFSISEIAKKLGVSSSTVAKYVKGE